MRLMIPKAWEWRRYFPDLARVALGAVFVGSGLAKIQQPFDFLADVYSYELVGPGTGYAVAFALPWLEFALGVCLIGGVFPAGGLLLTTLLLAVFTVVKALAVHRQLRIGCGCQVIAIGGVLGVEDVALTFAAFAASAAAYAGALSRMRRRADAAAPEGPSPGATPGRIG